MTSTAAVVAARRYFIWLGSSSEQNTIWMEGKCFFLRPYTMYVVRVYHARHIIPR